MRFFKDRAKLTKEQRKKRRDKLGRHLNAKPPYGHRGELPFPPTKPHEHPKLVRDWDAISDAMRFEHTPIQTVEDWQEADIIFVGIEGTPKCDAAAADARALGLKAVACSVPACWMWGDSGVKVNGVPELDLIATAYMQGKLVIVVPDDDWAEQKKNGDYPVRTAAYLLQERLLDLEINAKIHSPKPLPGFDKTGIDDSIAAGYHLTDMVGIDRQPPDFLDLRLWLKSLNPGASDTKRTHLARAYWGLAMHAVDADGSLRLPGRRMLAKIMGCSSPSSVLPWLNSLWHDYGAIESDRPLEMEVKFTHPETGRRSEDWKGSAEARATITLDRDHLATMQEPRTLGEVLSEYLGIQDRPVERPPLTPRMIEAYRQGRLSSCDKTKKDAGRAKRRILKEAQKIQALDLRDEAYDRPEISQMMDVAESTLRGWLKRAESAETRTNRGVDVMTTVREEITAIREDILAGRLYEDMALDKLDALQARFPDHEGAQEAIRAFIAHEIKVAA